MVLSPNHWGEAHSKQPKFCGAVKIFQLYRGASHLNWQTELYMKFPVACHFATYFWTFSSSSAIGLFTCRVLIFWRFSNATHILNFQIVNYHVQPFIYWISRNYLIPLVTDRQHIISTSTIEIVIGLIRIPQSFHTPKNQSSSEFFWWSSSHQLFVAIKIQYQGKLLLDSATIAH